VFDHSVSFAEHLKNILVCASLDYSRLFDAILPLFGIFLPNAAPTVMRAAWHHRRDGRRPANRLE